MATTRPLNIRQRLFLKYLAEGMSMTRAAKKAGYSPRSAGQTAHEIMKNPDVREEFMNILETAGATREAAARVVAEAMTATKPISAVVGSDATGKTMDFIDVPDHPTRLKAAEMVVDIHGVKAPKKHEVRNETLEDLIATLDDEAGAGEEA